MYVCMYVQEKARQPLLALAKGCGILRKILDACIHDDAYCGFLSARHDDVKIYCRYCSR